MFMENPNETSSNPVIVAVEQARDALLEALGGVSFGSLGDEESLTLLLALESVGRVVDGARVLSTTDVLRRSEYLDASVATNAAAKTAEHTCATAAPGFAAPYSSTPPKPGVPAAKTVPPPPPKNPTGKNRAGRTGTTLRLSQIMPMASSTSETFGSCRRPAPVCLALDELDQRDGCDTTLIRVERASSARGMGSTLHSQRAGR